MSDVPVKERLRARLPESLLRIVTATLAAAVFLVGGSQALRYASALPVSWPVATVGGFGTLVALGAGWSYWNHTDVLTLSVAGPIQRETSAFESAVDADATVEVVEEAAAADDTDAVLVTLNTPGGAVGPSEDIRRALADFDGPVVGYAEDVCASGGYLIATACDYVVAHPDALVGSIGVIMSHLDLSDLADDHGVDYESFTTGRFKDTGHPVKGLDETDRDYLQSLVDAHHDRFVERVAATRPLTEAEVRDLEARVVTAGEALDLGLVDETGDLAAARDAVCTALDTEPGELTEVFEEPGQASPFSPAAQAQRVAYAFGAGLSSRLGGAASDYLPASNWRVR